MGIINKRQSSEDLTDESVISFGAHKGKKLANVPAEYLIFLWDENRCFGALRTYIKDNLETLKMEIANNNKFLAK